MRPRRTDDKYWKGTRDFDHIQYESDLEDYIIDLEAEIEQLRLTDTVGEREELKAFTQYCESRQIKPSRFKWDEIYKDFKNRRTFKK